MKVITRIVDYIFFKPVEVLVIILGIAMASVVFLQVVFRYLMEIPFGWTEELARVLLLLWAMLGAALAYRHDRHMGLDFLEMALPGKWRKVMVIFRRLLVLVFCFFLFNAGIDLTQRLRAVTPLLMIPLNYVYIIVPVSMGLFIIWALIQLIEDVIDLFKKTTP